MIHRRRARVTRMFQEFISSEQSSGIILMISALLAIVIFNSNIGPQFQALLETEVGWQGYGIHLQHDLLHWINDGLMVIFFLLIGLEIERETYKGQLSDLRSAMLPILAAIGGMLVPALIHYYFNKDMSTYKGFGIPMATDIAFALGFLSLLGKRVPPSLKVFLAAFAIIDDIGAMIVIAVFYSTGLNYVFLLLALIVFLILGLFNRFHVKSLLVYIIGGIFMWYFMMESGVHSTLAGVLLAFVLPFDGGGPDSISSKLEHALNKPVAWVIMPIFALANAGVVFSADFLKNAIDPNTIGIFLGLYIGKPLGILSFSYLGILLRLVKLPEAMHFKHLLGAGFLGGIGFTMSMFITILAYGHTPEAANSKLAIITASLLAGMTGYFILKYRRPVRRHAKYKYPHRDEEEPAADVQKEQKGSWAPVSEPVNPASQPSNPVEEPTAVEPEQPEPIEVEIPEEFEEEPNQWSAE